MIALYIHDKAEVVPFVIFRWSSGSAFAKSLNLQVQTESLMHYALIAITNELSRWDLGQM
jgi:hypothetical protein